MENLSEEQIEKTLRTMPKFELSKKGEALFFKKLHALAAEQQEEKAQIQWFTWPRFVFAGSFVAVAALFILTIIVYQPTVTHGKALYALKQAGEKVELVFASSSMKKVDAHLKFSDRRLSEAEHIINKSQALAWLIRTALADGGEIDLNPEESLNLELTLADISKETSLASNIIETEISTPSEAMLALSKIEKTAEKHVESLTALGQKTSLHVRQLIQKTVLEEDEKLASTIEEQDKVAEAVALKLDSVEIRILKAEKREYQANEELQKALDLFNSLPEEQKTALAEKMERAKEALQNNKLGRAKGLSRALMNQLEKTVNKQTPNENENKADKKDSVKPILKPGKIDPAKGKDKTPSTDKKNEKTEKQSSVTPDSVLNYDMPVLRDPKSFKDGEDAFIDNGENDEKETADKTKKLRPEKSNESFRLIDLTDIEEGVKDLDKLTAGKQKR